jgi:alanine racemase
VTVDLDAIVHNAQVARQYAAGAALCGVVKADAYGHGALPVARALETSGIDWLAVALVEEGLALRQGGIQTPILVLAGNFRGAYAAVVQHALTPVVSHAPDLPELARTAGSAGLDIHVEVDTGMARLGVPQADLPAFLQAVAQHPQLRVRGLMSHLAHADDPAHPQNAAQMRRMAEAEGLAQAAGLSLRWRHLLNSGGLLCGAEPARDLVRCGLVLYGAQPAVGRSYADLRPALRWTTQPVALREVPAGTPVSYGGRWRASAPTRLATLPVGYADGFKRRLTNRGHVLVRGQRAPVVGAVCMDLCMVDVTGIPDVTVADEVVLLGRQGTDEITADMLGDWADSFAYEVLSTIGKRVPRRHTGCA